MRVGICGKFDKEITVLRGYREVRLRSQEAGILLVDGYYRIGYATTLESPVKLRGLRISYGTLHYAIA